MARKMLVMEDPILTNRTEDCDELFGGGSGRIFGDDVDNNATIEDQVENDKGEEDELEFALDALLKEVNVGEESYKTPTKGKSTVAISFEIEEFANVEVSLPPPKVGMVFDSWKKIDEYFRNYGKQEGFGVVRSSGTFVGKGVNAKEKKSVTWTCECFGMPGRKSKKTGPAFVSDSQIGVLGTPSSVCAEKQATPSTQRHGSCEGGEDVPAVHVRDPPIPKRPAHRTTDSSRGLTWFV
uniref:Uncharacterized protein n=1 Tax=Chenopodium quinoa TaxID=63459 RepID=A0A803LHT9_CHEQI